MRFMIIDTCDVIMNNHGTHVRLSVLLVAETSINSDITYIENLLSARLRDLRFRHRFKVYNDQKFLFFLKFTILLLSCFSRFP